MFSVNLTNLDFPISSVLDLSAMTTIIITILNGLIILMGVVGNGLVIYGSIIHKAIEIDWVSLIFIEALAVIDLLITCFTYLPTMVTLCAGKWVLGIEICYITGYLKIAPTISQIAIITAMSFYRSWRITFPFSSSVKGFTIKMATVLMISLPLCLVIFLELAGSQAMFVPITFQCTSTLDDQKLEDGVEMFIIIVLTILPLIAVVIMNVIIVVITTKNAARIHVDMNKKTFLTTSAICWVFILSYSPLVTSTVLELCRIGVPDWFTLLSRYSLAITVIANPFIYSITNKKFGQFLKGVVRKRSPVVPLRVLHHLVVVNQARSDN